MNARNTIRMTILATAIAAACSWATAQDVALYESHTLPDALVFEPKDTTGMNTKIDMIIKGPENFYLRKSFEAGEPIEFNPAAMAERGLPDGTYRYELRVMGINGVSSDRNSAKPAITEPLQGGFGAFSIQGGQIVSSNIEEAPYKGADAGVTVQTSSGPTTATDSDGDGSTRDQVINDDLIVTGSLCVGFDCVNGESFGFDTIRMKENNTRIKFDDTSTTGSFPNTDWQLTANDSANGGQNKFSIEDISAARVPFTIEGATPSNALYVDSTGNIGLGTSTPVLQAHIADGNTPGLRLEQDGSSGFQPQTWDVAGNEANFFVRDVTNGSTLPFRIRPGAPSSSIDIAAGGNVGIGTASPGASLHVSGSDGSTQALVEETSGTLADRQMLTLTNNGGSRIDFVNSNSGEDWRFATEHVSDTFIITKLGSGEVELRLENNGDLEIAGTLTQGSSRAIKTAIDSLDGFTLLDKLTRLDFAEWSYKAKPSNRHIGPMAEDFFSVFGLGDSDKHIAPGDMAGIAMAASKQLALENTELRTKLKELEQKVDRVDELQSELNRTQAMVETLIDKLDN